MAAIYTSQNPYSRQTLAAATSYGALTFTTTKPTLGLVYDGVSSPGVSPPLYMPSLLVVMPFASQTTSSAMGMRVVGWRTFTATDLTVYYLPTVIADFALDFTAGTKLSYTIDGATVAPLSSVTQGLGTPAANLYSPYAAANTNQEFASVMVDPIGSQLVTIQMKSNAGTMGFFSSGF